MPVNALADEHRGHGKSERYSYTPRVPGNMRD